MFLKRCCAFAKVNVRNFSLQNDASHTENIKWYKIKQNEIKPENFAKEKHVAKAIAKNIIFENDNIAVINKPHNLPCFSLDSNSEAISIEHILPTLLKKFSSKELFLTSMLPSEYSGIIILAKNQDSDIEIKRIFKTSLKEKLYLVSDYAISLNMPPSDTGIVTGKNFQPIFYTEMQSKYVKNRVLHGKVKFKVISKSESGACLVDIKTCCGILQQGLISMTSMCCPILGDYKYSQCIGYLLGLPFVLDNNNFVFDPANKKQYIPYAIKQALCIDEDTFPLHMHRHCVNLPPNKKLGFPENMKFHAPLPQYFVLSKIALGLE